ncbi:MAG TPA: hypothetical protein PLM98_18265 [Thiolinea sp.]|nr:hypothetical protein [Thiolinea sp.]
MELKIVFFNDRNEKVVLAPEKYKVISEFLESYQTSNACEDLKRNLALWVEGADAVSLDTAKYSLSTDSATHITIKSCQRDEQVIISLKKLLKLIEAWQRFLASKKVELSYRVDIKE